MTRTTNVYGDHITILSTPNGHFSANGNGDLQCGGQMSPVLVDRLSRSTLEVARRRSDMALEWLIRVHAPTWMDLNNNADVKAAAAELRVLPAVFTLATLATANAAAQTAGAAWTAASEAARGAAWTAARDAARDAAWDVARGAGDTAWDAADAAWDAPRDVARVARAANDAAWDAARAAAYDTAIAAVVAVSGDGTPVAYDVAYDAAYAACVALFAPTRRSLEASALDLIDRMLAVTPDARTT